MHSVVWPGSSLAVAASATPAAPALPRQAAAALSPGSPAGPCGPGWGPMGLGASDQRFIVMMIPHHQGAIAMAELALGRARHSEIRSLAQSIAASQSAEIAQMRQWYRQWYGTAVPALTLDIGAPIGGGAGASMGPGMGPEGGMGMAWGMPGMATSLEALRRAPEFDRAFLVQMIAHHRLGVMMASHAQWGSRHPLLRALEAQMIRVQSEEIARMAAWYRQWYGTPGG